MEIKDEQDQEYAVIVTYNFCRCCFNDGELKNMWTVNTNEGIEETYGNMISDCFGLSLQEQHDQIEYICDNCISKLQDAISFKQQVIASYEQMQDNKIGFKPDDTETGGDYLIQICPSKDLKQEKEETKLENTEYIIVEEDEETSQDVCDVKVEETEILQTSAGSSAVEVPASPKRKWPKKKAKHERKPYKLYSEDDLRKCIAAVRNGEMTQSEAAQQYNIPKKTLSAKIRSNYDKKVESGSINENQEKDYKLMEEIKIVLTYTNAVPFKTKTTRFYCAYCSTDGPYFEDPEELRVHTRTKHFGERTKSVDQFMRPYWLNEVLKLDIDKLLCTVCCTGIFGWVEMFKHLKEIHDVELDQAYQRIIPYVLKSEISCVLCKECFPNFHHLDGHMNSHYTNYVCPECGDTFLANSRLVKHKLLHNTSNFPCDQCDKVFTLDKYRRKHVDYMHKQSMKIKCLYCAEKFQNEHKRHLHVREQHKEKVKSITCELCGVTFDWKPYYLAHMRRKHNK